ncbi:antimicrobial peptide type 2 precursor IIb [Penaeus vannamei]|uniref:Antimicrobial peptide type 2 IIb n=1 Tax=Penaeus vannamei TaxID=6689 RepID=A0A423TRP7_PENVA|nr:antimicrobial peptide type 2 precursor IIb [Penaeus vannamei]
MGREGVPSGRLSNRQPRVLWENLCVRARPARSTASPFSVLHKQRLGVYILRWPQVRLQAHQSDTMVSSSARSESFRRRRCSRGLTSSFFLRRSAAEPLSPYWCKTPQNQAYCCEDGHDPVSQPFVKPGSCPPVRPQCPPVRSGFRPPNQCSNDSRCPGHEKCCYDTCLEHHTCKAPGSTCQPPPPRAEEHPSRPPCPRKGSTAATAEKARWTDRYVWQSL